MERDALLAIKAEMQMLRREMRRCNARFASCNEKLDALLSERKQTREVQRTEVKSPNMNAMDLMAIISNAVSQNTQNSADSCAEIKCKNAKTCAICMGEIAAGSIMMLLPCEHTYHPVCIKEWFKQKSTCPECRANVNDL